MTLQAKIDDEIGGSRVLPDETAPANSEGAKLRQFLDRVKNVQAEIDSIMDAAKAECAPLREDIAAIKKEANEAGFPRKELNAVARRERLANQIEGIRANLDDQQKERYDVMVHALGQLAGLPLGEAAAEKHPDHPGKH